MYRLQWHFFSCFCLSATIVEKTVTWLHRFMVHTHAMWIFRYVSWCFLVFIQVVKSAGSCWLFILVLPQPADLPLVSWENSHPAVARSNNSSPSVSFWTPHLKRSWLLWCAMEWLEMVGPGPTKKPSTTGLVRGNEDESKSLWQIDFAGIHLQILCWFSGVDVGLLVSVTHCDCYWLIACFYVFHRYSPLVTTACLADHHEQLEQPEQQVNTLCK